MKVKLSFLAFGTLVVILAASVIMAVATRRAEQGGTRVLKLAHGLEATHPVHLGMEFMKKRMQELSGGKLSMDIYSGGALGSEIKCIEQIKNGSLDMTKASSAQLGTFVPQLHALTLPYLFRDHAHYWKVLDSKVGEKFLDFLKEKNMHGLCFYDAGSRSFYTAKKPIRTPSDLVGLKIRVMNSRADMETIAALGASPTPISSGETYTAIAQGVVDGAENNLPTYFLSGHSEIAKYFTLDEHTSIPDVLLIGEKTWKTLSADEQKILRRAARESSEFQRKLWAERTKQAYETLKKKGIEFYIPNKAEFSDKTKKIYDSYKGTEIGTLVEEIKSVK